MWPMRDGFRKSTNIPLSRLIIRQLAVGTMKIICDSLGNDLGVIRLIQRDLSFDSRASRCAYQNDYSAGTILPEDSDEISCDQLRNHGAGYENSALPHFNLKLCLNRAAD